MPWLHRLQSANIFRQRSYVKTQTIEVVVFTCAGSRVQELMREESQGQITASITSLEKCAAARPHVKLLWPSCVVAAAACLHNTPCLPPHQHQPSTTSPLHSHGPVPSPYHLTDLPPPPHLTTYTLCTHATHGLWPVVSYRRQVTCGYLPANEFMALLPKGNAATIHSTGGHRGQSKYKIAQTKTQGTWMDMPCLN